MKHKFLYLTFALGLILTSCIGGQTTGRSNNPKITTFRVVGRGGAGRPVAPGLRGPADEAVQGDGDVDGDAQSRRWVHRVGARGRPSGAGGAAVEWLNAAKALRKSI